MSKRDSCHGCEGKGWVMVTTRERVTPYVSQSTGLPVENAAILSRDCGPAQCPVCHGTGVAKAAEKL